MKAFTVLSDCTIMDPDMDRELSIANEFVLEALKAESGNNQIEFSPLSKNTSSNCSAVLESHYGRCSENDLGWLFQSSNDDQSLSTLDLFPEQLDEKGLFSNYMTKYFIVFICFPLPFSCFSFYL